MSHASSLPFLETLDDVRTALLNRIPAEHRGAFFTPLHPLELTHQDLRIDSEQLATAIRLIRQAIEAQQKVLIYGDYDCDGVTSTAVLWMTLQSLGLRAQPFVPRRDVYGYGMSVKALQDLWQEQAVDLVITVDNGIVAHESVEWAKSQGAKVIITDHHHPGETLPPADAVVHSSLLCGVGVAWAVARELDPDIAQSHLDLVAIGTLADQVSLVGANRSLTKFGLEALQHTSRASLKSLASIADVDLEKLTTSDVTFRLAPRINAMGRLADPMDALRALVSRSPQRIQELLKQMEETNRERQDLTQSLYAEVLSQVQTSFDPDRDSVIILGGEYHEGVIGLLASKLVEQFHTPAIIVSTTGDVWKASCRSIPEVNMVETLRSVEDVEFAGLGGHALAAGFSLFSHSGLSDIEKIKSHFREKHVYIDVKNNADSIGSLSFQLLNSNMIKLLEEFEPFGSGNGEPQFLLPDITFQIVKHLGKSKQHWKGNLVHASSGHSASAIFFRASEKYPNDPSTIQHVVVKIVPSNFGSRGFDIHIAEAHGESN